MPYIRQPRKVETLIGANGPGELNYALTRALVAYLQEHGLNYRAINDCLGALEGAKLEFYRRVAVPYEEEKMCENGDVYPPELVRP